MSVPLIPPLTNPAGYPSRLFIIDTTGVYVAAGRALELRWNASSGAWTLDLGASVLTIADGGANWVIQEDGSTVSTGPADNVSPVGAYTGAEAFTVQSVPPGADVTVAEVTLSPGEPGTLIPEV